MDIFGIPHQALLGQIMLGLVNGAFYAVLSLGLAIIFGLLRIVNFAHGAFFMLGAFVAFLMGRHLGIGYWPALIAAPLVVGLLGILFERFALRRIYRLDPLYGLFLTFGLVLVLEGGFRVGMGSSGHPFPTPAALRGVFDLGFMILPIYRAFVILMAVIVCAGTWIVIEKTRMGAYLRAATERPELTQAFGINVPKALGDFLVLEALYATEGRAIAVSEAAIDWEQRRAAQLEGTFVCPEGAAVLAAAREMATQGEIPADARVVALNTGAGIKYPDSRDLGVPRLAADEALPIPDSTARRPS